VAYLLFCNYYQEDDMVPRIKPEQEQVRPQEQVRLYKARRFRKARRLQRGKRRPLARRVPFEIAIAIIIGSIFTLKLANYIVPADLRPAAIRYEISTAFHNTLGAIENAPFLSTCEHEWKTINVPGGYVCVQGSQNGIYARIYDSYPLVGQGRESIYADVDQGNIGAANDLLRNRFDVPRYNPVQLGSLPTWSENPYAALYWRLEFYSLRPTINLLYAFRTTGNVDYVRQLRRLDLSFIAAEGHSRWAWSDPHAVAFRSMVLVDDWWKLRQAHQLPEGASSVMLRELVKTGDYLADPNHYQPEDNHGVNEAAALYELAIAFPTLPHASQWLAVANQRFRWDLNGLIDSDGQLIENSPYYDFYTLQKYCQIYEYALAQHQPDTSLFKRKIARMLHFATYILQPDSQVPLLGASIEATINDFGSYRALGAMNPQFLYVLTHGTQGSVPSPTSIYFPAGRLSVFRSGWGNGADFARSTYLTYYIGHYRTEHSNPDALSITLYGDGGDLLPDGGLYTYTPGAYRNYFHGTAAHNTVVVDGKTQALGGGAAGRLATKDGITYQSGESSLYAGVVHRRLVMMLDATHLLVLDRLSSASIHTYSQLFHLFPGARLLKRGLTVSGVGGSPRRELTIQQLRPAGISEQNVINRRGPKPDGLCSVQYGRLLPCYAIHYSQRARDATFLTLLTIGPRQQQGWAAKVMGAGQGLHVRDGDRTFSILFGQTTNVAAKAWATDPVSPRVKSVSVSAAVAPKDWTTQGVAALPQAAAGRPGGAIASISTNSSDLVYLSDDFIRLNLEHQNARIRLKATGLGRLREFKLMLSNDHWKNSVTENLADAYTRDYAGQWANLFVGPSGPWGPHGGWTSSAPGFDWSRIDGIRLEISTHTPGNQPATVSFGGLQLFPAQKQGKLVFVFDDGYQSILPAASYMRQKGIVGDVAVIGRDVDNPTLDHLNMFQLKLLQNKWGWDIANHTQDHVDAVQMYYHRHDMSGYVADILQQAVWLESHGLNSAPNWLIYPHGAINEALERVVSRYYMFARVTADGPDAWPYGDPHAISDLEIQYPGDGEAGDTGNTSPAEILAAVRQAEVHHMTLILTFHRIHSQASDRPGYPFALFKQIVNGVLASHVKVMTLSQLDHSNGVSTTNHIFLLPARPSQITANITT
jgi:peptidoglycan/xylan/chitin deacetylase (PgdA/CDA1 family)